MHGARSRGAHREEGTRADRAALEPNACRRARRTHAGACAHRRGAATRWMDGSDELPRRAGWRILAGRIERGSAKELDVGATLARIERSCRRLRTGSRRASTTASSGSVSTSRPTHHAIAVGERLGRWDPRRSRRAARRATAGVDPGRLALCRGEKTEARKAMDAAAKAKKPRGGGQPAISKARATPARSKSAKNSQLQRHVRADRPARAWGEAGEGYRGRGYCCAVARTSTSHRRVNRSATCSARRSLRVVNQTTRRLQLRLARPAQGELPRAKSGRRQRSAPDDPE